MTAKILGGFAAALLVIGIGAYAAGVGGTDCPFSGGQCDSASSQCSVKESGSCCSMNIPDTASLSADADTAATEATTETKSIGAKKSCCSEKE